MLATTHKRSAFVLLVRDSDRRVYCVKGHRDDFGIPGGKGEPQDRDDFTIAAREFYEETGHQLPFTVFKRHTHDEEKIAYEAESPQHFYDYVAYGDVHHNCTFFFKLLDDEIASTLSEGLSPDPQEGESEVAWVDIKEIWERIRMHIQKGIRLVHSKKASIFSPLGSKSDWSPPRVVRRQKVSPLPRSVSAKPCPTHKAGKKDRTVQEDLLIACGNWRKERITQVAQEPWLNEVC